MKRKALTLLVLTLTLLVTALLATACDGGSSAADTTVPAVPKPPPSP